MNVIENLPAVRMRAGTACEKAYGGSIVQIAFVYFRYIVVLSSSEVLLHHLLSGVCSLIRLTKRNIMTKQRSLAGDHTIST